MDDERDWTVLNDDVGARDKRGEKWNAGQHAEKVTETFPDREVSLLGTDDWQCTSTECPVKRRRCQ